MNSNFFTETHAKMTVTDMEHYHRAIFLNMEGEYAAKKPVEYYRSVWPGLLPGHERGRAVVGGHMRRRCDRGRLSRGQTSPTVFRRRWCASTGG